MRSNIMANDASHRHDFKSRLLNRVIASLEPPEPQRQEAVTLLLPHNYQEMGEAELHNTIAYSVELNHSPETAFLALDILFGRIAQPDHVQFQLVYLQARAEPVKNHPSPLAVNTPDPQRTAQEANKRRQFKADLSEKINTPQTLSVEEPDPEALLVRVPDNYRSLSSEALYGILVSRNILTPEQAQDLFAMLGGRKVKSTFTMAFEPEAAVVATPESKTVQVTVPTSFKTRKVTDQYAYLVRQLALAPEEANDVIDILKGKPPISTTIFEIIEED